MAPKKKTEDSEDKRRAVLTSAREAIADTRPRDAISSIKNSELDYDAELVYVLASAFRDLVRPVRKYSRPVLAAPVGTQESVDELQRLHDLETELHTLAREAALTFEDISKAKLDEGGKGKKEAPVVDDVILLLYLEIADFKRYILEALEALRNPSNALKEEISGIYAKVEGSLEAATSPYIALRLAINRKIFEDSEDATAFVREVASKEVTSPKVKKTDKDAAENREPGVAVWPVTTDELARLRKKVVALANYFLFRLSEVLVVATIESLVSNLDST